MNTNQITSPRSREYRQKVRQQYVYPRNGEITPLSQASEMLFLWEDL